ncbi:hypothetical protein ACFQDN_21630 [Pseudomonas asuensis]|jgi:hypothetical protein|nr:hypothetical protein [Pseudomonas asuensis]
MKPLIFFRRFTVATLQVGLAVCVVLLWPKFFGVGQLLGDMLITYLF